MKDKGLPMLCEAHEILVQELDRVKNNQSELYSLDRERREQLSDIQNSITQIKEENQNMKNDITELKADMSSVKSDMGTVKQDLASVKTSITKIEANTKKIMGAKRLCCNYCCGSGTGWHCTFSHPQIRRKIKCQNLLQTYSHNSRQKPVMLTNLCRKIRILKTWE